MLSDDQIRRVLPDVSNPLSIGDNPNLADMYDEFNPAIKAELVEGASRSEMTGCLVAIEKQLGHFEWDDSAAMAAAAELIPPHS